jgi:RNA methyltransferase, TrmH family
VTHDGHDMTIKTITSPNNQRVKDAVKLRDRRQRGKQQRCFVDGAREILLAIEADVRIVESFVCEPLCNSPESFQALEGLGRLNASMWHVTPEVFEKLAFGQRQEGVLAVAETPRRTIGELIVADGVLIAVVCGLEKPGNVGAVLRSADATGVAAVIVADGGTDLYNPNCIRASLGTVFTLAVCEATTGETIAWLHQRQCKIFATRLDATRGYADVDYRGNAAVVLGSEAVGLSAAWQTADVTPIKLPMLGKADSLNVSATAAVLFYEALRQRDKGG